MTNRITHLGTATTLLEIAGLRILTDPVLDPAGSSYSLGSSPLSGELRYRNVLGAACSAGDLPQIDLVLLSHDHHRDNLDEAGLAVARRAGAVWTTVSGARRMAHKGLAHVVGLAPWSVRDLRASDGSLLRVTAAPARHGPIGTNWFAGDVIGFLIEHRSLVHGPIYVTGDTRWFRGVHEVGRRMPPLGLVLAHVGAARFGSSVLRHWLRFSMDASEALRLARTLRPTHLVPIHYDGWDHFSEGRAELERAFADTEASARLRWLPRGEAVELDAFFA